jgi:hypothetical protein
MVLTINAVSGNQNPYKPEYTPKSIRTTIKISAKEKRLYSNALFLFVMEEI